MVSDWNPIGGISAQFNSLAVRLNLPIVANSGVAIAYDVAPRKHCAAIARQCRSDADFSRLLPEGRQEAKKQVYSSRPIADSSNYTAQENG